MVKLAPTNFTFIYIFYTDIQAGRYHIIIHYYQPNHPGFESRTGIYSGGGSGNPGKVALEYCPNLNGCRAPVKNYNDRPYVFVAGKARFRVDIPDGKDAWIVSDIKIIKRSLILNNSKEIDMIY